MYQRRILPLGPQAIPVLPQLPPHAMSGVTLPVASPAQILPAPPSLASELLSGLERGTELAKRIQDLRSRRPVPDQPPTPTAAADGTYEGLLNRFVRAGYPYATWPYWDPFGWSSIHGIFGGGPSDAWHF